MRTAKSDGSTPPPPPDPGGVTTFHVRRAIDGDQTSFAWLVERLAPLLVAQASWRLGPVLRRQCDPEDLVSDAWLRTLPRLRELPARDGRHTPVLLKFLSTTILNVVNNLAKKHLRRGRLESPIGGLSQDPVTDPIQGIPADVTSAVSHAVRNERRHAIAEALASLEEKDREVILLRGIEQRSNGSVAALLGISPDAAGMRYSRALARLRGRLPGSVFDELE